MPNTASTIIARLLDEIRSTSLACRAAVTLHRSHNLILPLSGTGQTDFNYCRTNQKRDVTSKETAMGEHGAVFQPELIKLMRVVLDDAVATLPEWKRTSTMMADIASQILACAANGERDPAKLRVAAMSAVVECSHYSHDISPERRAV